MKKHLQAANAGGPSTPGCPSDRQDVDLSVSAQLRALKDYAKANGYSVAREYVDEAESGPRRRPAPVPGDDRRGLQAPGSFLR